MALINCKECKKEISSEVKQCPHCGSSKHRGFIKKHPIVSIFIGLFAIGYIPTLFIDQEQIKQKEKEEKNKIKEQVQQELKVSNKKNEESPQNNNKVEETQLGKVVDNWQYQIDEDKMRGVKKLFAMIESTNTLQLGFPYNDSKMAIMIRKNNKETDVLISVKGQIVCHSYSERCYLDVKADDNKIVKYDFNEAAHGTSKTVFIEKEKEFIKMLKNSKKLIIEVPLFNHGRAQYDFDVSGLKWEE